MKDFVELRKSDASDSNIVDIYVQANHVNMLQFLTCTSLAIDTNIRFRVRNK